MDKTLFRGLSCLLGALLVSFCSLASAIPVLYRVALEVGYTYGGNPPGSPGGGYFVFDDALVPQNGLGYATATAFEVAGFGYSHGNVSNLYSLSGELLSSRRRDHYDASIRFEDHRPTGISYVGTRFFEYLGGELFIGGGSSLRLEGATWELPQSFAFVTSGSGGTILFSVPETSTFGLLAGGLALTALVGRLRSKKRSKQQSLTA